MRTAAQVYKYPFSDQLLIHAQRPDATACASIQFWNKRMKRWVNRGSKGIALLDDNSAKMRLKYVFDVSDTHPARGIPDPYFWQMQPEYEKPVMEALANSLDDLPLESTDFRDFLYAAVSVAVQDHIGDYLNNYEEARAGTLLEELDEDAAAVFLKDAVTNSVAYAAMVRCGLDADSYLHGDEFTAVCQHNSPAATLHLGTVVSDITRVVLSPIERTVKNIEQQNLFDLREKFAKPVVTEYHKDIEKQSEPEMERSNENGDYLFASGDYLLPNLTLPEQPDVKIGKYGRLRKAFLKQHRPVQYNGLLLSVKLDAHLAEIDRTARQQVEQTMAALLKTNPAPDKMTDPMGWVKHQNAIKAQAEEIVIPSLIYS